MRRVAGELFSRCQRALECANCVPSEPDRVVFLAYRGAPLSCVVEHLQRLEESTGWRWVGVFLAWVFLRNLLESALERPHELGFDWRASVSFSMLLLHFPLFYFFLFLSISLWLALLSRRRLRDVVPVTSLGFSLILIAPILDALASGGAGYDLRYLRSGENVLVSFWNPFARPEAISPGQRVEILAAMVLAGAYVFCWRRARRWTTLAALAWGLLAGAGTFLLAALAGSLPAIAAHLLEGSAADSYAAFFRAPGLLMDESRRHALVFAVACAVLGFPWVLALETRFRAVVRRMGLTRLLHYTGLAPAGVFLGWLLYRDFGPLSMGHPADWLAAACIWLSLIAAFVASVLWNDVSDRRADAVIHPERPVPRGLLAVDEARRWALAAATVAVVLALVVSYHTALIVGACLVLSWLYSSPPVRLKRVPVLATLTLAILSVLSALAGFSLFAAEASVLLFPGRIAGFLLLGVTVGFIAKDLKDEAGDRIDGVVTLATLLGPVRARRVAALLVAAAFGSLLLFFRLSPLATVVLGGFAAVGALLTLRIPRPDSPLLGLFLLFALLFGIWLSRHPDTLLPATGPHLLEDHALILGAGSAAYSLGLHDDAKGGERGGLGRALPGLEELAWGAGVGVRGSQRSGRRDAEVLRAKDAAVGLTSDPLRVRERALWLLGRLGSPQQAIQALKALAAWLLGHISHREGKVPWAGAVQVEEAVGGEILLAPESALYLEKLASKLTEAGHLEEAADVLESGLSCGLRLREMAVHAVQVALGRFSLGEIEEAAVREALQRSFLLSGGRPENWRCLGDFHLLLAQPAEALGAYEGSIDAGGDHGLALAGRARALHALGRIGESVRGFRAALAKRPSDPVVLNNLGVALMDAGDVEGARAAFLEARRANPNFPEPLYNLGRLEERGGRPDSAVAFYEACLKVSSSFEPAHRALQRLSSGLHQHQPAAGHPEGR